MPRLLQITVGLERSIGRIAQQIGEKAIQNGWESWIAYGARSKPSKYAIINLKSVPIKVGSYFDSVIHYFASRLFDREGFFSKKSTKKLISRIYEISPDIVVLHNIHDHWINYPLLFKCLAELNTNVVWVQHDCWAITGGCVYFSSYNCEEWKKECNCCTRKHFVIKSQSKRNFNLKFSLLQNIQSLTFVTVSDWIGGVLRESIQKERPILTIHNGVDISKFSFTAKRANKEQYKILGVAAHWDKRKGFDDFVRLRAILPEEYSITLVGIDKKKIRRLPSGIVGLPRTNSIEELAGIYGSSDVFVQLSYADTFPTTNLEALACGTPVITYNTGGSPEAVDVNTGIVVPQGDIDAVAASIIKLRKKPLSSVHCRERIEKYFNKDICFDEYIRLFNKLLKVTEI